MWNPFKPRAKRTTIEAILDDSGDMATKQSRTMELIYKLSAEVILHNEAANASIMLSDLARIERARVWKIASEKFATFNAGN